jgi:hypothetical protein
MPVTVTTASNTHVEEENEAVRLAQQIVQNKAKKEKLLALLVDVVLNFCQTLSGTPLYAYQKPLARRIIESLVLNDGAKLTALYSRQSGKTETIGCVVSGIAVLFPRLSQISDLTQLFPSLKKFHRGIKIGIFAPILDQAQTLFGRIKFMFTTKDAEKVLSDPDIAEEVRASNGAILAFSGGSIVECRSAAPTSNIESKTYHLLVIDESQDVDSNKIRKSISPMGAFTRATMVMAGTCNTVKSAFYEQITKNKHDKIRGEKGKDNNHFEYDYTTVQKYREEYRLYIQDEISAYGEDSDEFRMSYRLQWIFERGMFVSNEVLQTNVFAKTVEIGDWHKFRGWSIIAGLDFGKSQDSTILTLGVADWVQPISDATGQYIFYKACVLDWLELYGDDWNSQFYQIMDKLREYPSLCKMVADSTGVGAGLVDRFADALPNVQVDEFSFSLQSKSDGYKNLNMNISKKTIWLPAGPQTKKTREWKACVQQLTDLTKEYRGANMICAAPDNIRNAHDDYPDSLMMFAWAAKEPAVNSFEQTDFSLLSGSGGGGNWLIRG